MSSSRIDEAGRARLPRAGRAGARRDGHRRWFKRLLPRSLYGRSLIIIILPLVLAQLLSTWIFYDRHCDTVQRRLAASVAGDIALTLEAMRYADNPAELDALLARAADATELYYMFRPGESLPKAVRQAGHTYLEEALAAAITDRVRQPFQIDADFDPRDMLISIELPEGVMQVAAPRKRLFTPTTYIFVLWMAGSSLVLLAVASLFMRNQVRALRCLADAAESFGKGRDVPNFRLEGATEVRQAAAAFLKMRDRIKRQITQRTEMLAGVSHDLRTPLTRMRLAFELLGQEGPAVEELKTDVQAMERMVEGYLDFARGEGPEQPRETDLALLIEEAAAEVRPARAPAPAELGWRAPQRQPPDVADGRTRDRLKFAIGAQHGRAVAEFRERAVRGGEVIAGARQRLHGHLHHDHRPEAPDRVEPAAHSMHLPPLDVRLDEIEAVEIGHRGEAVDRGQRDDLAPDIAPSRVMAEMGEAEPVGAAALDGQRQHRRALALAERQRHDRDIAATIDVEGDAQDGAGIAARLEGEDPPARGQARQDFRVLPGMRADIEDHAIRGDHAPGGGAPGLVMLLERRLEEVREIGRRDRPAKIGRGHGGRRRTGVRRLTHSFTKRAPTSQPHGEWSNGRRYLPQMPEPCILSVHPQPSRLPDCRARENKAARPGGLTRRTGGRMAARSLASARGALLGEVADLLETLGDPLLNDVERLGIGLGDELGQLAGIGDTPLESMLCHLDVLGDLLLGGDRLRPFAQRYRGRVHRLPRQLDLPAGNSLHTLNCQLIGLRECLEVLALRGHHRFHVETGESEAGKSLAEIHVEKGLLAVDRHRLRPSRGCLIMLHCTIADMPLGPPKVKTGTKNTAVQNTGQPEAASAPSEAVPAVPNKDCARRSRRSSAAMAFATSALSSSRESRNTQR